MTAGLEAIHTVRPAFDTCGLGDTVRHKESTTCCPSLWKMLDRFVPTALAALAEHSLPYPEIVRLIVSFVGKDQARCVQQVYFLKLWQFNERKSKKHRTWLISVRPDCPAASPMINSKNTKKLN